MGHIVQDTLVRVKSPQMEDSLAHKIIDKLGGHSRYTLAPGTPHHFAGRAMIPTLPETALLVGVHFTLKDGYSDAMPSCVGVMATTAAHDQFWCARPPRRNTRRLLVEGSSMNDIYLHGSPGMALPRSITMTTRTRSRAHSRVRSRTRRTRVTHGGGRTSSCTAPARASGASFLPPSCARALSFPTVSFRGCVCLFLTWRVPHSFACARRRPPPHPPSPLSARAR